MFRENIQNILLENTRPITHLESSKILLRQITS